MYILYRGLIKLIVNSCYRQLFIDHTCIQLGCKSPNKFNNNYFNVY